MPIDDRAPSGATNDDDWLESLLRSRADDDRYIDDAGFTASVLERLPARHAKRAARWIVPVMAALGFVIGLVVMAGGEALSISVARLASFEPTSLQKLLLAGIPLAILYAIAFGAAWQQR